MATVKFLGIEGRVVTFDVDGEKVVRRLPVNWNAPIPHADVVTTELPVFKRVRVKNAETEEESVEVRQVGTRVVHTPVTVDKEVSLEDHIRALARGLALEADTAALRKAAEDTSALTLKPGAELVPGPSPFDAA